MSSTTPSSSSVADMPGSKKFRHAILKNLLLGLRKGGAASRVMGFHERRGAIRRAADAALATARGAAPRWSRSLAAELSQTQGGRRPPSSSAPSSSSECKPPSKMSCATRRIPRRRLRARPKSGATAKQAAGALARVMVRKRARALRAIVPGGRGMDECTLLGETLDYAVSLKAQVEAMQLLLRTLQAPKNPSSSMPN